MNLLSSLLKFTADKLGALISSTTSLGNRLTTAEGDIDSLEAQFTTVVSAVTTDTEVTNIRVGDDGVTYDTAGNAVRTQFSQLKSEMSDSQLLARSWVDGSLVRYNNGAIQANSDYSYISFDISKYSFIHVVTYMASVAGVCFYDSDDNFIAGYQNANPSDYAVTLNIPVNAKYIKISCVTQYKDTFKIYANIQEQIDSIKENFSSSFDSFDMGLVPIGNYKSYSDIYTAVITSNGNVMATTNNLFHVRKYPVTTGDKVVIKGTQVDVHYDTYGLASFSSNNFVGTTISSTLLIYGSGATPTNYNVEFVVPCDGYIYLASYGNEADKPTIELYEAGYVSKLLYSLTNANENIIKIQAFGDSITDDSWRTDETTWLTLLPDYLTQRQLSIKNEAVGGAHIGHGRVNSDTGKYHELEYNYVYDLMTNNNIFDSTSDIIVMFVGTNDFNSSPLGEWGDNTVDTFYGAARLICEFISQNTSALFLVVTPIARPSDADTTKELNPDGERVNSFGATLRDYAEALIRTCEFYQFPVVDLFHDIGWNQYNIRPYLDTSGIHPSIKGSNAICAYISSEMKKHLGI